MRALLTLAGASLTMALLAASPPPALAQATAAPPAPVQSAPLAPPPGASPPATLTPAPEPQAQTSPAPSPVPSPVPAAPPAAAAPAADPDSVLAGRKGDASIVEEVTLAAKPALIVAGQSSWDDGFENLRAAQNGLRALAARLGLQVAGRPVTYFVETDDMAFRFEAMLPVSRAPDASAQIAPARAGETPSGRALRFVHIGPYEDIDGAYEGITAYLDAKGVTVRDQFIEEYANEAKDKADPAAEVNIYVMPR